MIVMVIMMGMMAMMVVVMALRDFLCSRLSVESFACISSLIALSFPEAGTVIMSPLQVEKLRLRTGLT